MENITQNVCIAPLFFGIASTAATVAAVAQSHLPAAHRQRAQRTARPQGRRRKDHDGRWPRARRTAVVFRSTRPHHRYQRRRLTSTWLSLARAPRAFLLRSPPARRGHMWHSSRKATAISQGNTASGIITDQSNPAAAAALRQLLVKESAYRADADLIDVWIENGGEAVKWVLDHVKEAGGSVIDQGNKPAVEGSNEVNGYSSLNYVTSYMGPKPYNNGEGMKVLADVAAEAGVEIFYSTPAEQLVKDGETKSPGVIAKSERGLRSVQCREGRHRIYGRLPK